MPRSSESVASLASALAKAQAELINPEKSLQGQIQALQIELENPSHALALLRPRRERPRNRRTAEQREELAPLHSITSSARASNVGGISRPSALAVSRLIISSTFVD